MAVIAEERTYTPEDLLALPDDRLFELVGGRLVEKNMGAEATGVAGELFVKLHEYARAGAGGRATIEASFQCFGEEPTRVRRPDVAYIRSGRLDGDRLPKGHIRIIPDLAVEVTSPNDLHSEVAAKVDEYLNAGVPLVWVMEPETRTVEVFRRDGTVARLRDGDELTGEDVLPGFRCSVRELFPPREEAREVNP